MMKKGFKQEEICLYNETESKFHEDTKLAYCLVPGNTFTFGDQKCFVIKSGMPLTSNYKINLFFLVADLTFLKAVHAWLKSISMEKYSSLFCQHDLEDFFALPFLSEKILEEMGVQDKKDIKILTKEISELKKCSPEDCKSKI